MFLTKIETYKNYLIINDLLESIEYMKIITLQNPPVGNIQELALVLRKLCCIGHVSHAHSARYARVSRSGKENFEN